jgi:hypothetical protein
MDWLLDETAGQLTEPHRADLPPPTLNPQVQGSNPWGRTRKAESIIAPRKFNSSELLDAGFDVSMIAQRQGHAPGEHRLCM